MDEEKVSLNLNLEVWMKYRETPVSLPLRIDITPEVTTIEEVMDYAHAYVARILDSRSHDHILILDERYSHHMVMRDDLQILSIQAPDADSIPWGEESD